MPPTRSARSGLMDSTAISRSVSRRRLIPSAGGTLAQLDPPDLARQGLRQLVDELDLSRVRVRRQSIAHESLDGIGQLGGRFVARGRNDERLHDVAPSLI